VYTSSSQYPNCVFCCAAGSYQTYIVKKGDKIGSVALSHGMKKAELSKVNSIYGSPQLLRGQALLVRAEPAKPPPPPAAAAATAVLSKSGHGEDILSHSGHLLVDFKREPVRQRKAVHRAASDTGLLTRMSAAIFSSSSSNSNSASSSATDSDTGAVPAAVTGVSSLLSRHRSRRTTLPNLDHEAAAAAAAQNSTNASAGAAAARTWRSYFTTPAAAVPENSSTITASASSSSNGDTVQARAKSDCTAAVSSAVAEAIATVSTTATATDTQEEPVIVIARRRSRSDITSSSTHNNSDVSAHTDAANSSDSANTSTAIAAAAATADTTANDDAGTANNGEQYWSSAVDVDGICSAMHSDDEADVSADVRSDVIHDEPELPTLVQHYYTTTASGKQQHYTVPLLVNGESDIVLPQAIALMEEALPDNRKGYNWVLLFSTFK
jgi:LysM repeat protein